MNVIYKLSGGFSMTSMLSSKFFRCVVVCFFVLAGYSVANAQNAVSSKDELWQELSGSEADFIRAASKADYGSFNRILEEGEVDINVQDINGNTAIMLLTSRISHRNYITGMIVSLLNSDDIDLTIENNDGLTVFDLAKQKSPYTENLFSGLLDEQTVAFLDNVRACDINNVTRALNFGVDPNLTESEIVSLTDDAPYEKGGKSALIIASEETCQPVVRALLRAGVDVNYQLENGRTALMFAVENWTILNTLLREGNVDINIQDMNGRTALMHAIYVENYTSVVRLINSGDVDFTLKDEGGQTPILAAKSLGNVNMVRYMRPHVSRLLHRAIEENNVLVVNSIVAQVLKSDNETIDTRDIVNFKAQDGNTPLLNALSNGSSAGIVYTLVSDPNTDLTATALDGKTALMLASRVGEITNFKKILSAEQNINAQDNDGKTALIHAVEAGQLRVVNELLADERTSIGIQDVTNSTALEVARTLSNRSIISVLERATVVSKERFFEAATSRDLESFRLHATGTNINERDEAGETALIKASRGTNITLVNEILSYQNIDANVKADNADTALTVATQNGRFLIVAELLKNPETHVDVFGTDGKTALMWAILENKSSIARLLVEHGADVTLKDKETGKSVLTLQARSGDHLFLEVMASQDNVTEDDLTEAIEMGLKETSPDSESLQVLRRFRKIKTNMLYKWFDAIFGRDPGVAVAPARRDNDITPWPRSIM